MPTLKRRCKDLGKRAMRKLFEAGQRCGVDLLPRHFYSEIPDIRELRGTRHWRMPYTMQGVSGVDPDAQLRCVAGCCPPAMIEVLRKGNIHERASLANGETGFGSVEADFLFAFVATRKPCRIFQIGCGVSTAVCLLAAEEAGYAPEITCVEPYPTGFLLQAEQQGRIRLLRQKAQELELSVVAGLPDDLLFFVDSSHTLGPAGEVSRIILEMLPRLQRGACIHFHDILFPYDYSRDVLGAELTFTHESALLHAFLACNSRFRILASLSMLHYARSEALAACLPNYRPAANEDGLQTGVGGHFPSSTYLEVTV